MQTASSPGPSLTELLAPEKQYWELTAWSLPSIRWSLDLLSSSSTIIFTLVATGIIVRITICEQARVQAVLSSLTFLSWSEHGNAENRAWSPENPRQVKVIMAMNPGLKWHFIIIQAEDPVTLTPDFILTLNLSPQLWVFRKTFSRSLFFSSENRVGEGMVGIDDDQLQNSRGEDTAVWTQRDSSVLSHKSVTRQVKIKCLLPIKGYSAYHLGMWCYRLEMISFLS